MITLNGVNKIYGNDVKALNNIDLQLRKNKVIGLIGKNGAGKTTLIETIIGLLEPSSGDISYTNLSKDNIGYLPDEPVFINHVSVLEMLHYINLVRRLGLTKEELINRLQEVDLAEVKDKPTENLSRGMRQRLAYVVATLHKPNVLLLDEPFTGLDPVHLEMMKKHLIEYSIDRCIVFSTHIFAFASQLCNEFVLLDEGKIKEIITLKEGEKWREDDLQTAFQTFIDSSS
ncbi:ABC transporter ATP-binding protein [Radiobacillus deserti]|uniref:ABC transporter ATP-binding protein n=1 Tax=Radiobacillus deserti TaxID=2594883 RepID=A0A516KEI4_9BACI|nr:ABC transporter ATP-binding protein [Radiobacillus deserti]QDP39821.1 ABC transporter ATP-binding protein [Radiobacillus deserti]